MRRLHAIRSALLLLTTAASGLPVYGGSEDGSPVGTQIPPALIGNAHASSSFDAERAPLNAVDGDDSSAWCAANQAAKVSVRTQAGRSGTVADEIFGDWWEAEFKTGQSLGAIYMKSGYWGWNAPATAKIRDFVWAYQPDGRGATEPWILIPETSMYANRYQLILRFQRAIPNVKRLRLLIRPRYSEEIELWGKLADTDPDYDYLKPWKGYSTPPCLREARFYGRRDERIATKPWFYTVNTFEDDSIYSTHHWVAPDHKRLVQDAIREIAGADYPDLHDEIWYGEFLKERVVSYQHGVLRPGTVGIRSRNGSIVTKCAAAKSCAPGAESLSPGAGLDEIPEWITHEPAPSGFLLSGNDLDYKERSYELASGLLAFLRNERRYPILGACGGLQMTAQAVLNVDAAREFYGYEDSPAQVVTTCGEYLQPPFKCHTGNCLCNASFGACACAGQKHDFSALAAGHKCGWEDESKGLATCCPCRESEVCRSMSSNSTTNGAALDNAYKETRQDLILNFLDSLTAYPNGFKASLLHWDMVNANAAFANKFHLIATYHQGEAARLSAAHSTLVQGVKLRGYPIYGTQFHWDDIDKPENDARRIALNFVAIAIGAGYAGGFSVASRGGSVASLTDSDKYTDWCSSGAKSSITLSFREPNTLRSLIIVGGNKSNDLGTRPSSYSFHLSSDGKTWNEIAGAGAAADFADIRGNDGSTRLFRLGTTGSYKFYRIGVESGKCLREIIPLPL